MRSSLAKVGLLDKSPVSPWIYKEMVNLEVSSIFFFYDGFLEYKSKVCFSNESCHHSKIHPRQPYQILWNNVLHIVSVRGLLSAEHSGSQVLKIPED